MTVPIRVLLADDDPLVLSGLKMMLAGAGQVQVAGEAHDGRGVLRFGRTRCGPFQSGQRAHLNSSSASG